MKLLHTADWHIGQLFHDYDRSYEHRHFLTWLLQILRIEQIDVLLVSGDIFDLSNPGAASIKMFYTFLSNAISENPSLQIIITAGNHDSPTRLESPKPLLESSNIHIVGHVERNADGEIDYEKLIIPVKNSFGTTELFCLAIPFLRMGDYPTIANCTNAYVEGVAALYQQAFEHAAAIATDKQGIIAMGHLHAQNSEVTDLDKSERAIMGGVECIAASAFHEKIGYVALGHIHKAQRLGGKEHIRYSGSPIPLSFSELNYKHQVVLFYSDNGSISNIQPLEIPQFVDLMRIPSKPKSLNEVLAELNMLPNLSNDKPAPYLEVRVLLTSPEPALRHKIEGVLEGKNVRLAKIDVSYPSKNKDSEIAEIMTEDRLLELKPFDVFTKVFESKYQSDVPQVLVNLFHEVSQEVSQKERNT